MSIQMPQGANHSIHSATLAEVLERVLDKGLVIAGDIKVKLVDIELLTIQIRLVVASVEKAREMGLDWWTTNTDCHSGPPAPDERAELAELKQRLARLEALGASELVPSVVAPAIPSRFQPA
jgi:Gas vesicle protein